MAKIHVNGEIFAFDQDYRPMAEMLALEKALNTTYGQWEQDMQAGSARALAGFIWLVWHRNGREVDFAAIESGEVEINYATYEIEADDGEPPGPTTPADGKEASSTTGGATSRRSASSASARGK